jgi:hypothetical protein
MRKRVGLAGVIGSGMMRASVDPTVSFFVREFGRANLAIDYLCPGGTDA